MMIKAMPTELQLHTRTSVLEEKIETIKEDVCEIKNEMKDHRQESSRNISKLSAKIDYLIWAIILGMAGIVAKVFIL